MNPSKYKDRFCFLPLGGSGEIGMNVNLYHADGKWIMIDLGAGFADKDQLPGIDMLAPNLEFAFGLGDNLLGLVLTHAHEDHLGAVVYYWQQLKCPIYATPFTANVLKAKLAEIPDAVNRVNLKVISPASNLEIGPFKLEMIHLTHSIPEMQAIALSTRHGTVMHTGDWKFDDAPLVGPVSDYARFEEFGKKGVLAMICDSTNVLSPGHSGSEGDLRTNLTKLIGECKQMVVVTTFASNIARVETIARAASANGRKVVMMGRSLWRITNAAREAGYLHDVPEFLEDKEAKRFPREKLLVISTGCQGEPLAATTKLAHDLMPTMRLHPKDTVIFSSKIIPGNDKRIFALFNQLVKRGIQIMTEKDHFVHVSGHPYRDELKRMYDMVKPKLAIPVHGEAVHLHEHCRWAKQWGVPQTIEVANGDLVSLAPGTPEKLSVETSGYFAVDGNFLMATDSPVLKMRRRILNDGILFISVVLSIRGELLAKPRVSAPGMLDDEQDRDLLDLLGDETAQVVELQPKASNDTLIKQIRNSLKRTAKNEIGKYPTIEVQIIRV